jgi:hypothetical protein
VTAPQFGDQLATALADDCLDEAVAVLRDFALIDRTRGAARRSVRESWLISAASLSFSAFSS